MAAIKTVRMIHPSDTVRLISTDRGHAAIDLIKGQYLLTSYWGGMKMTFHESVKDAYKALRQAK